MGEVLSGLKEAGLLVFLAVQSKVDIREKQVSVLISVVFTGIAIMIYLGETIGKTVTISPFLWIGGLVPGTLSLVAARLTQESIGYGDGIVLLVCGLFLGLWGCLELLLMGLCGSAFYGAILIAVKKVKKGYKIAFVPFLLAAYLFLLC